ncbi:NAD(P)-binding protein [Pleurotus eryngii]|uniref:NAD(P)-binding protein n=1 Tax=Pleurotus eryngii TaxID=5323 RepID=A0A9P6A3C8_PLEER|nr:NAD(P)-binding protein [Pleurotus eryngii]
MAGTPSEQPIRVGFIGLSATGWAAHALFPSLRAPSVRNLYSITALCTSSPTSAAAAAAHYGRLIGSPIKHFHGTDGIKELAFDPEVDLVVVSVKAPSHRTPILAAINAGKDVFAEWPIGTSLQQMEEIEQRAKDKGVTVVVGLQGRQSVAITKAKEIIQRKTIGKILSSSLICTVPRELEYWGPTVAASNVYIHEPDTGASLLEIMLGHQLDTFTHLLGDFKSVSVTSATMYPTATILRSSPDNSPKDDEAPRTLQVSTADHVAITGMLVSGAIVSIICRGGYAETPGRQRLVWEIDGEEGSIRLEGNSPGVVGPLIHRHDPDVYLCGEKVVVEKPMEKIEVDDGAEAELELAAVLRNEVVGWLEYAKEKMGDVERGKGNSGTSRAIVGKGAQYIKMIECPKSIASVLQLPVPGGGVANGDDQNRFISYQATLPMFNRGGNSIFDFHGHKQGVTITSWSGYVGGALWDGKTRRQGRTNDSVSSFDAEYRCGGSEPAPTRAITVLSAFTVKNPQCSL